MPGTGWQRARKEMHTAGCINGIRYSRRMYLGDDKSKWSDGQLPCELAGILFFI